MRGEGTKVIVVLHLNQESIRITWWRNQIRVHLSWPMRSRPAFEEASNLLSAGVSMGPGLIAEIGALARDDQPTCGFQYNHNLLAIVVVNLGSPLQVEALHPHLNVSKTIGSRRECLVFQTWQQVNLT